MGYWSQYPGWRTGGFDSDRHFHDGSQTEEVQDMNGSYKERILRLEECIVKLEAEVPVLRQEILGSGSDHRQDAAASGAAGSRADQKNARPKWKVGVLQCQENPEMTAWKVEVENAIPCGLVRIGNLEVQMAQVNTAMGNIFNKLGA